MGERGLDEPAAREDAVVAGGLVVSPVVDRAERGGVDLEQRAVALGPVVAVGRIAEGGHVDPMVGVELEGQLARVGDDPALARPLAHAGAAQVHRRERESSGGDERAALELGVDGAEEEHLVLDDRTTEGAAEVEVLAAVRVHGAVHGRERPEAALDPLGLEEPVDAAVEGVGAALGDDVHDAAGGHAVFRLEAARLDLRFLDEVGGDAVAQGAEHDRVGADGPVARVADVHAVDDVAVVEAAGAADRGVGLADAAAVADAGHEVERVREVAADGQALERLALENAARGRGAGVDGRSRPHHLDDFRKSTHLQREAWQIEALAEVDVDVLLLDGREPGQLDLHGVPAGGEVGREEAPVAVGHEGLGALVGNDGNGRSRNGGALGVDHRAGDRARSRLLRRGDAEARHEQQERPNELTSHQYLTP